MNIGFPDVKQTGFEKFGAAGCHILQEIINRSP